MPAPAVSISRSIRSRKAKSRDVNLRMVIKGCGLTTGGIMAAMRLPSGRRRFRMGESASSFLPKRLAIDLKAGQKRAVIEADAWQKLHRAVLFDPHGRIGIDHDLGDGLGFEANAGWVSETG